MTVDEATFERAEHIYLNAGEVAQMHHRLYKIQLAARVARSKEIINQARLLLLLVVKAERREAKARRQRISHNAKPSSNATQTK
ncbi:MAG: hypothetical protein IJ713_07595 [Oscillibacter sp.]|nr:hypothetical protein [Oscillibacter sp.]MBR1690621.1 hypothetical protein [Oscillibacter sp.]